MFDFLGASLKIKKYGGAKTNLNRFATEFDQPGAVSRKDAFLHFAGINPLFRHAHTLLMPWLSGAEPTEGQQSRQFPFGIDILPELSMRLRSSWRNETIGETPDSGTVVLAINGSPTKQLIADLAR